MVSDAPSRLALLVVSDDDTRRAYAQHLHALGYDLDHAVDGREALAKALTRCPAVVITEARPLGMSGYDLCRILRSDPATRAIPVVILTGDASAAANIGRAEQAGADAMIGKPCLPETLAAEIDRVITGGAASDRSGDPANTAKRTLSHVHQRRVTTAPPVPPPQMICPLCDKSLVYQQSHVGGVSARHAEQWDYFECPGGCGTFQYRSRTRRLRRML